MPDTIKGRIVIFSIVGCPYCIRAKTKLDDLGLPYYDLNLDSSTSARSLMIELTGKKTVPQIFFNAVHVGGFSELNNLSSDELNKLINDVTMNEPPSDAPAIPKPNSSETEESDDDFDFTCELDEYAAIVKQLKESGLVKDIRQKLTTHKNSFIGREAVDWLVANKNLERAEAVEMCKSLIEKHFGHSVKGKGQVEFKDNDTIYRFLEDTESNALNAGLKSECEPRPAAFLSSGLAVLQTILHYFRILFVILWDFLRKNKYFINVALNFENESSFQNKRVTSQNNHLAMKVKSASEVGEELRKLILKLYNDNLSRDGKRVDYQGISKSERFKAYVKHTAELQRVVLDKISREEKIAFFINVYNTLVIHAFITVGPPVNLWQRYKFFNVISYIIGGHVYSLNEIENGILRSNRKAIGSFRKPFQKGDPRHAFILPEPEPRIHFALVCGAKSCPPIKTYSANDLENQLQLAAESYLESDDGCVVDIKKKEVKLSQILKWYKEDFGRNKEEVVQWVYTHIGASEKKNQLGELLQRGFKLSYMPYDWGVNSK